MEKVILSWADIDKYCALLFEKINHGGLVFDAIVGIQRGGLFPAVILSHKLNVPDFYSLGITTIEKEGCNARLNDANIKSQMLVGLKGKRVLVVDDVTETGVTFKLAKELIEMNCPKSIATAALVWNGPISEGCQSDFYALRTSEWVVFPWEEV